MQPFESSQVETVGGFNCCWQFQGIFSASGSRTHISVCKPGMRTARCSLTLWKEKFIQKTMGTVFSVLREDQPVLVELKLFPSAPYHSLEEIKLYQISQDNEWMPVLASPAFLCHLSQCDTATSSGHGWSLQETRTLCCTHVGSWAQITDHAARQLCRQGSGSPGGQQGAPPLPSAGKAASGERKRGTQWSESR